MTWSRDTPWRQGTILDPAALAAIGVPCDADSWAVVVSHDCDLAHADLSKEPTIEIIVCNEVMTPRGLCLSGATLRELHIAVDDAGTERYFSLKHTARVVIGKNAQLDSILRPELSISPKTKSILQRWMSARYFRHALPDALGDRINNGLKAAQRKIEPHARDVVGVYLSHEPHNEELQPADDYHAKLVVVFSSTTSDEGAAVKLAVAAIQANFDRAYQSTSAGTGRVRVECVAYADTEFTLYDASQFAEIRWDELSHSGDDD